MEVDTNRPLDLDGQVEDEDLIDFDADMVDHTQPFQEDHPGEPAEIDAASKDSRAAIDGLDVETYALEARGDDFDLGGDISEVEVHQQPPLSIGTGHEDQPSDSNELDDTLYSERHPPGGEDLGVAHDLDAAASEYEDISGHEIDYDQDGMDDEAEAPRLDNEDATGHAENEGLEKTDADNNVELHDPEHDLTTTGIEELEPQMEPEHDEITWEVADEEPDHGDILAENRPEDTYGDDTVEAGDDDSQTQGAEADVEEGDDHENDGQDHSGFEDYSHPAEPDDTAQNAEESEVTGPSMAGRDSTVASEDGFPTIMVHYKGDEFPLFSTGSDGFFSDTSVLHDDLEKLLAGFREELSNEIAHEDEIVFQIDELGLEFSESTSRDCLLSVTLNQVLEIFDLLVKNQDPDSSRTPYTYLFTKPNATRRLESLTESAADGRGLDEVIHLFETPVHVAIGPVDGDDGDDGDEGEGDEYESPVDDVLDAMVDTLQNEEVHAGEQTHENLTASHDVDEDDEDNQDFDGEDSLRRDDAEGADGERNANIEPATPVVVDGEFDPHGADQRDSNEFLNLALGESADLHDNGLDVHAAQDGNELETAEGATRGFNHSSTTSTLRDENDENGAVNAEAPVNTATAESAEDALDEIDWRDEAEAAADEQLDPSTAGGKRTRPEEDDAEDDEQDSKRRRS